MISEQIEEYLEAIGRLEERGERITTSSLARERGVTAPSVTEMLGRLGERGLVTYRPRGEIALTDEGRAMARSVMRRHRLWERFLHDVLGVHWDRVHREACRLEHATSEEVEDGLARAIGDNPTCPHGNTIPGANGESTSVPTIPLPELPPAIAARVVSVRDEDPIVLREIESIGLMPGSPVTVRSYLADVDQLAVEVNGEPRTVPLQVAAGVRVAPVSGSSVPHHHALSELPPGQTAKVLALPTGKSFLARCLALGFTPGTPVTMVQNPGSGPLLVMIRNTRVALGKGEAQKIQVTR